jgi:8-oxo-dGTP diphosphatase
MNVMLEIHPIQAGVLRYLLFNPRARFSELNEADVSSDKFSFHLRRLVGLGLIEKKGESYELTTIGKEFANRLDTDERVLERQGKLAVMVVPTRVVGDTREYLIQRRLKQPYFGYYGFLTGKIRWGETVLDAAGRELAEESGLTGTPKFLGIQHKFDQSKEATLLEDKYFFVVLVEKVSGAMAEKFEGGENVWMTEDKILNLDKLFKGMETSLKLARGQFEHFSETVFTYDERDY